jgi:hypothetical protein
MQPQEVRVLVNIRSKAMKSDVQLQQDVLDELDWEPSVNGAHIGVAVTDGIVTLTGHRPLLKNMPPKARRSVYTALRPWRMSWM